MYTEALPPSSPGSRDLPVPTGDSLIDLKGGLLGLVFNSGCLRLTAPLLPGCPAKKTARRGSGKQDAPPPHYTRGVEVPACLLGPSGSWLKEKDPCPKYLCRWRSKEIR